MYQRYGDFHVSDHVFTCFGVFLLITGGAISMIFLEIPYFYPMYMFLLSFFLIATTVAPYLERFAIEKNTIFVRKNKKTQEFSLAFYFSFFCFSLFIF